MATKRGNGIYYVQRTFQGVGKIYRSIHTRKKGRAQARERVLVSLHQQGRGELVRAFDDGEVSIQKLEEYFETGRIHELAGELRRKDSSLAEACEAVLGHKEPDVKASTLERYRTGLDHFKEFAGQDATVRDVLTEESIQGFKKHRLNEGVAEQTVNNDLGAVSILITHAMKKGWIDERPEIKRFEYKARIRWLEAGQLADYLDTLRPAFRPQMELLLGTGMRLGESEKLRVCDLRLGKEDKRAMVEDSKTANGVRTVFIPAWAAETVESHIEEHGLSGTDGIFQIDRRAVQAEHNRACDEAGIPDYTIHDHRHTAAVHLARAGMPLHLLQQQLGHKDIEMTMKYSRFHPDYADVVGYFNRVGDRLGLSEADASNNNPNNTPSTEAALAAD